MYLYPSQAYIDLLRTHHRFSVGVFILDQNRRYLFDMTNSLVSGTVDIDTEGDVSRSGKCTLLDPQQRLSIDFNGAGFGSNISNRSVQITYTVQSMDRSYGFTVPIFTGPITYAKRDGVVINIDFKGMEYLLQDGWPVDRTWPAGWTKSQAIMDAARATAGIQDFADYVGTSKMMLSDWSVEGGEDLWARMREFADNGAMNIFFNGNGVLQIKHKSGAPAFTVDSTWLTEEPDFTLNTDNLRNICRVEGAFAPGTETRMWYEAWPPAHHPFSPQSLQRNGVLRVIPRLIRDDGLTAWSEIIDTAWANLGWDLLAAESNTCVVPVIPFLEEYDVITINHPKLHASSPLTKATIPLVGDAEMSLNMFTTTSTGSLGPMAQRTAMSNKGQNRERLMGKTYHNVNNWNPFAPNLNNKADEWYGPGGKGAPNKGGKKKNRKDKDKKRDGKKGRNR